MRPLKITAFPLLLIAIFAFSGTKGDEQYPDNVLMYSMDLLTLTNVAVRCGDLHAQKYEGHFLHFTEITDKNEIRKFISIFENKNNFNYRKDWYPPDVRTTFEYFNNGKWNWVCFDNDGRCMERNDTVFETSKEVRKYLLSKNRMIQSYKDLNPGHSGTGPYPDSTYKIPLIPYYDTL
jgi:hypothetical protein